MVELLPLALTMPLFSIDEARREKEREKQKALEQKVARPRIDSIFNPEAPELASSSKIDMLFEQEGGTSVKKSLVGAWGSSVKSMESTNNKRKEIDNDEVKVKKNRSTKRKKANQDNSKRRKILENLNVDDDAEEGSARLLWGPEKSKDINISSNDVKIKKRKKKESNEKLNKDINSPWNIDTTDDDDDSNIEFVFDDDEPNEKKDKKEPAISFTVDSDDEVSDNDGEIIFDAKGGMDTDDEGDDVVFDVDEKKTKKSKHSKKKSNNFSFTMDDCEEVKDTHSNSFIIETDSTKKKTKSANKKSSSKRINTSQSNILRNSSNCTNKRLTSMTDEDRKPSIDSPQTVQKLFQIDDDDEKASLPSGVNKTSSSSHVGRQKGNSSKKNLGVKNVIAEKFIVQDKDGNERGSFGLDNNNTISIQLSDTCNQKVISIEISNTDSQMGIQFKVNGKKRLSHSINRENDIETSLFSSDFNSHCKMCVNANSPEVTLGTKQQTFINLRGTQDISELNPSNALVSLRSDPGFSGLSICDTSGGTRATLGWYDLKKLLRLENETDLVMIQMSGREASKDLDNFPEATISVIDNVAKFYAKDKRGGVKEVPPKSEEDDVSVLVNIEKQGAQLGIVIDGTLRTLGSSKTQQLLNAYGFNIN